MFQQRPIFHVHTNITPMNGNEILWHVVNMAEALIDIKTSWAFST